jgi:hypothetical protein
LGGWVFDARSETGMATGAVGIFAVVTRELVAAHATQQAPELPYLVCQLLRGETWIDPLGGDPSGYRLIRGDRDLRA